MCKKAAFLFAMLTLMPISPVWADDDERQAAAFIKGIGGTFRQSKLSTNPTIVEVTLKDKKVTDEDLKQLASLRHLYSLDLSGTPVTNAGLKELALLTKLYSLDVSGTNVTDAGLKELAPLKELVILKVQNTRVTDEGVKELRRTMQSLCKILR